MGLIGVISSKAASVDGDVVVVPMDAFSLMLSLSSSSTMVEGEDDGRGMGFSSAFTPVLKERGRAEVRMPSRRIRTLIVGR